MSEWKVERGDGLLDFNNKHDGIPADADDDRKRNKGPLTFTHSGKETWETGMGVNGEPALK